MVVLIDVQAFGLTIPVLPHLIKGFVGGESAGAAYWVAVFGTTSRRKSDPRCRAASRAR